MEYKPQIVDTSLDLNILPLRLMDDAPIATDHESIFAVQDAHCNFIGLGINSAVKEESSALMEELSRVSAENKKLTESLTAVSENYKALRNQLMEYMSRNPASENAGVSRKRKAENSITNDNGDSYGAYNNNMNDGANYYNGRNSDQSSSSDEDSILKKPRAEEQPKITRVCVKTEASDTSLLVKDGYQWRKYGQKVTRDNPCPRAYFKCSFAPSCPVKKKVQRSIEDQSVLVATYEGEHNHPIPSKLEAASSRSAAGKLSNNSTATFDLTKPKPTAGDAVAKSPSRAVNSPEFQKFLVEQMASSLTKDPGFKAALAASISGRILQHNNQKKNC